MTKLYHGTTAAILDRIQAEGLAPRSISKGKSNWKHSVESNKDAVYLTNCYAWHFAASATKNGGLGLILEIDKVHLSPWLLCPDEDTMEQATRQQGPTDKYPNLAPIEWSMEKRTKFYRKNACHNPQMTDACLDVMGTCGYYGTIPWSAITRYVLIDWKQLDLYWSIRAVDSMVSIINYKILADRHKAFTRWFFDDSVTAEELTGNVLWRQGSGDLESNKRLHEQDEMMMVKMRQRDGITIVNCKQTEDA